MARNSSLARLARSASARSRCSATTSFSSSRCASLALGDVGGDADQADDAALLVAQRRLGGEVGALRSTEPSSMIIVSPASSTRRSFSSSVRIAPRLAHRLAPRRIGHQRAPLAVLGEDQVRRAGGDRIEQRVPLAQRGARALERRGAPHHALVELGVGLAHRALGTGAAPPLRAAPAPRRAARRRSRIGAAFTSPGAPLPSRARSAGSPPAAAAARACERRRAAGFRSGAPLRSSKSCSSSSHRPAGGLGRAPAGEALRGGVEEAHPPGGVGGDHAVADARRASPAAIRAARSACAFGLRALRRGAVERVRHPQDERAERAR